MKFIDMNLKAYTNILLCLKIITIIKYTYASCAALNKGSLVHILGMKNKNIDSFIEL